MILSLSHAAGWRRISVGLRELITSKGVYFDDSCFDVLYA